MALQLKECKSPMCTYCTCLEMMMQNSQGIMQFQKVWINMLSLVVSCAWATYLHIKGTRTWQWYRYVQYTILLLLSVVFETCNNIKFHSNHNLIISQKLNLQPKLRSIILSGSQQKCPNCHFGCLIICAQKWLVFCIIWLVCFQRINVC